MRTLRVPIGRAGALIDIEIGVSTARRNALVRQGRDVLNRLQLEWNGPGSVLTISYP